MKLQFIATAAVLFCAGLAPAQDESPQVKSRVESKEPKLQTDKQKAGYGIGHSVGTNIGSDGLEIDLDALIAGIRDALAGEKSKVERAAFSEAMGRLSAAGQKRVEERMKKMAASNKKEAAEFLAANGKKKGVVTLPSGLQYLVLKAGTGRSPATTNTANRVSDQR